MKKLLLVLCALGVGGALSPAPAQTESDRVRFEWVTGFLMQGSVADADFILDSSPFGGPIIERSDGSLDVDPSLWFGLRGTYRLARRVSVSASWMHSRGRWRVQFPAQASIAGNFDLEGLILAGEDFVTAEPGVRAESAMSDAVTDVYLATATYEFPILKGWAHPMFSVGGGLLTQKSDGDVIRLQYETIVPSRIESAENLGFNPLSASGLSVFSIDETNWVLSFGLGMRASISGRWGVAVQLEDIVRMNADLSEIEGVSTPPPDPDIGRLYSTTFDPVDGLIHNFAVRLSLNYALWPYRTPR